MAVYTFVYTNEEAHQRALKEGWVHKSWAQERGFLHRLTGVNSRLVFRKEE